MTSADWAAAPVDKLAPHFDLYDPAHAAFGLGVHRCIGLHFARMQIEIAWEALLSQLTNFRVPPGENVEMARGVVLTAERLPVAFDHR